MADFHEFPDNSESLFGRRSDLAFLLDRATTPGITAIYGQPQMGKTWLLEELGRQLTQSTRPSQIQQLLTPSAYLVGYHEALGESQEVIIQRAVLDLYTRWLSNSTFRQQAHTLYLKKKETLLTDTARAAGSLFETFGGPLLKPVSGLVKGLIDTLASANQQLNSPMTLPRLQAEQVRELLQIVHEVASTYASPTQLVLIFDQWEHSTAAEAEANLLNAFLSHGDRWSPCHFFIGLRPDDTPNSAFQKIRSLGKAHPHACLLHELLPIQLDAAEETQFFTHLRQRIPATESIPDSTLRSLVAGNPAVIDRWRNQPGSTQPELKQLAVDAKQFQYPELEKIIHDFSYDHFQLALRIAFTPLCSQNDYWPALHAIVLGDQADKDLFELRKIGLLEKSNPPSLRHQTQWEALRANFLAQSSECLPHLEELALSLAEQIRTLSVEDAPFGLSLSVLENLASDLTFTPAVQLLFVSFRSITGRPYDAEALLPGKGRKQDARLDRIAVLLSIALKNSLAGPGRIFAPGSQYGLLQELRSLAATHSTEPVIRKNLASGLFSLIDTELADDEIERADLLLRELRTLATDHPGEPVIRENLAHGLYNTLNAASAETHRRLRDSLLHDLRRLAHEYRNESPLLESLARALYNSSNRARDENNLALRDSLLEELRELSREHTDQPAIRKELGHALHNALFSAREKNDRIRRDKLLDELRQLAHNHSGEPSIQEDLAKALFDTMNDSADASQRDAFLEELRQLAGKHPEQPAICENLAKSLMNLLVHATRTRDHNRRDALFLELATMIEAHPEEPILQQIASILGLR